MTFSSHSPRDNQANQVNVRFIPKADDAMILAHASSVDCIIYQEVIGLVSCTLDELVQQLPAYSWAQVFAAVDRLSRRGTLKLSRTGRFGYGLSVCSDPPHPSLHETGGAKGCVNWTGDPILAGT
jgi:hypothetical protein